MYALVIASTLVSLSPGVAPPSRGAWAVEVGLTGEQVGARTARLGALGYRPVSISAYNAAEANRFAVVYQQSKGPAWDMNWALTPDQLLARARDLGGKGYVLVGLSGSNQLGEERLSDLWLKQKGPQREFSRGLDGPGLTRQANLMGGRGYRPVWVSSYMAGGLNTYAAIWEKRPDVPWDLKYGLTAEGLQSSLDDLSARGYRPLAVSAFNAGGVVRYSAVWEKRKGPAWVVRYGQTQAGLLNLVQSMSALGYRPVMVTGYNTLSGERFVSLWEEEPPQR